MSSHPFYYISLPEVCFFSPRATQSLSLPSLLRLSSVYQYAPLSSLDSSHAAIPAAEPPSLAKNYTLPILRICHVLPKS